MSDPHSRPMFAGYAIGAAARFHRLDNAEDLDHVIPTLGMSVLASTGGRSESRASDFRYTVEKPRPRCLFSIGRVDTWTEGRGQDSRHETEFSSEIGGVAVLDKLRIELARLHLVSVRTPGADAEVRTNGSRLEGVWLGNVEARVTLDDEPLAHSGTADRFEAWHRASGREMMRHGGYLCGTIVRAIELVGPEQDRQDMTVEGHMIRWKGFGRIILGEIHVKGHERRVTMVRLAMGSDAAGTATITEGQTNGQLPGG